AGAAGVAPSFAEPRLGGTVVAAPSAGRPELDGTSRASDWAQKVWDAAVRGDSQALADLLDKRPEGVDADGRLAKAVAQLKSNIEAREAKRGEQSKKVRDQLEKALAEEGGGDLAVSQALKAAVELHMLATDKDALMREA